MISIVIPAFKRRDDILRLLADIYRQEHPDFEVIVVDDNSPDGTSEAIRERFPQTTVLRNEINRGPAVSRNRGIRHARGEIVVGFDSDVTISDPKLLARTEATFREWPNATLIAFRLLLPDGSDDTQRWWHPLPMEKYTKTPFQTDYFSGTGYAFRREEVIGIALYPEYLFMHYEEVEMGVRILDSGGTIVYAPHLEVHHHVTPTQGRSRVRTFYKPRNEVLLAISYFPAWRGIRFVTPRLAYSGLRSLREGNLGAFLEVLVDSIRLFPSRFKERKPLKSETWRKIAVRRGGDFEKFLPNSAFPKDNSCRPLDDCARSECVCA